VSLKDLEALTEQLVSSNVPGPMMSRLFKRVIEDAPIGITIVGRDCKYIYANSRFSEMVGYGMAELKERTYMDITHPEDVGENLRLSEEAWETGVDLWMLKRYIHKNGSIVHTLLGSSATIRPEDPVPEYGIGVLVDLPVPLIEKIKNLTLDLESK